MPEILTAPYIPTRYPCGCQRERYQYLSRFTDEWRVGYKLNRCRAHVVETPGAAEPDGFVRWTTTCPRCGGPSEHEALPAEVAIVDALSICEGCYTAQEAAREVVA